jgi:hypothetical protein
MNKQLSIIVCVLLGLFLMPATISLAVSPDAGLGNRTSWPATSAGWSFFSAAQEDFDCISVEEEIPLSECEALVDLYNATNGDQWTDNTGWLTTITPCSWTGIDCSEGHVISLLLNDNKLQGALPDSISDLSSIEWISLSNNFLTAIPATIGDLDAMTYLYLDGNQLTALPESIGDLINLQALTLENNQLTSIPDGFGNLTSLFWLDLSDNMLTNLPATTGNMMALKYFYIQNNQLTSLPTGFGNLTNLLELYLHKNPLSGEIPDFLTSLTKLGTEYYMTSPLTFYSTNWCVPAAGPVPAWLDGIEHEGTGLVCGQSPGGISGTVTLSDTTPLEGIQIYLFRPLGGDMPHSEGEKGLVVTQTLTTGDGSYQIGGLGQDIGYLVHFVDPTNEYAYQYYDNQIYKEQATPVTVTLGMTRTGIDAVMSMPVPPFVSIDTENGAVSFNPDGTANVNQYREHTSPITVTLPITCSAGIIPTDVNLVLTPPFSFTIEYPMSAMGADLYRAFVPANDMNTATLTVAYACDGVPSEIIVGHITVYDPSGIISDAHSSDPVVGAMVKLYYVPGWIPRTGPTDTRPNTCESNRSKDAGVPWSQPAPTELGVVPNPEFKPYAPLLSYQLTDAVGYYGWDVSEGCWYVEVEAVGYESLTSPVVGVPPEVTDLDLTLTPKLRVFLPLVLR